MIKTNETSKTIDREHSLSFEGVGRNKTNTESVRLENWPKFPCVSEVRPREQGEGRGAYSVLLCTTSLNGLSTSSWQLIVRAERENNSHSPFLYSLRFIGEVHGKAVAKDRTCILRVRANASAEKLN